MDQEKFINLLLILGMLIGISLALFSSIKESKFDNTKDWAAKVGEGEISQTKYSLQLEGLNLDKRSPLTQDDRAFVLERMIEEELLIQRAKDLGMFSTNTMIRGTIVQQMINMIVSENSFEEIETSDLKSFYKKNLGFFTSANRLRLKQIYFSDEKKDSYQRALEVYQNLVEGHSLEELIARGDKTALQIPNTLMTLSKVREYIGPSLMKIAMNLRPGEFTSPKKMQGGYKIIYLIERRDALPPEFNQIKDRVKSEYQKRKDDQALRNYLDNLKNWYEIERNLEI